MIEVGVRICLGSIGRYQTLFSGCESEILSLGYTRMLNRGEEAISEISKGLFRGNMALEALYSSLHFS